MTGPARNSMAHVLSRCVESDAGCWIWQGAKTAGGYGRLVFDNVAWMAHRLTWNFFMGDIPEGLQLDHLCRTRECLNPWHLEPVPPRVNTMRGEAVTARFATATKCVHGHPFDDENTYLAARGERQCRTCKRLRGRVRDAKRRARQRSAKS